MTNGSDISNLNIIFNVSCVNVLDALTEKQNLQEKYILENEE